MVAQVWEVVVLDLAVDEDWVAVAVEGQVLEEED